MFVINTILLTVFYFQSRLILHVCCAVHILLMDTRDSMSGLWSVVFMYGDLFPIHNAALPFLFRHAPPLFLDKQSAGARGRLAWTHNMYEGYSRHNNKQFLLNKVSYTRRMIPPP